MGLTQLSGLDASFLYLETGRSFGHVSSILILDRPDDPDFDPYSEYRARIERAVVDFVPLRRRLVEVPFGLDHPYWADDPDFDLDFHVRHVAVPPPGGAAELDALISRSIGRPLDRSKPLWEAYVIEGLENDRFAIFTKMHHSTIDGVAGAMLTQQVFSESAVVDLREAAPSLPHADPIPRANEVLNKAMFDLARRPRRMLRWQRRLAGELLRVGRSEHRRDLTAGLHGVPRTPFNASISPNRRFTWRAIPLAEVKAVKAALGCTVNDVVMAMCAGALRNYLLEHDALPDDPLVAMIPVSIRTGDEADPWTNRVSSLFVTIPTDLDDPTSRIAAIGATMAEGKQRHDLLSADLIVEAASLAPGLIAQQAARIAMNPRITNNGLTPANVTISNVPGPRDLLSLGGAPVRHYVPVSTVVDGQGLNITVQSYRDTLDLGLVSCRELVPDLDRLADLHTEEFAALKALAGIDSPTG
ncbi:MAG: wax ester/triacylglycerol synthase family O-acyltransferase [Acidimicrobiales bacterium]